MDETDVDLAPSGLGVPLPSMKQIPGSGLYRRSLSHGDHILLLEIDNNGTVRKEHVVSLISSMVENIVVQTVERILLTDKIPDLVNWKMLYISHSRSFRNFFKSVLSILMLNIEEMASFRSHVEEGWIEIVYNKLKIIEGSIEKALVIEKGEKVASLTIDLGNLDEEYIINALGNVHLQDCNIVIAYNSRHLGRTPTILLNHFLMKGHSNISLFDYATGQGLSNIIDASFENLLHREFTKS